MTSSQPEAATRISRKNKSAAALHAWNPADYAANSVVQQTWARELIARLHLRGDEHILDVGCGDGKVTAELARAVPRGTVVGVDASAEMIAFADSTFSKSEIPNLKFRICDAREIGGAQLLSPSPPPALSPGEKHSPKSSSRFEPQNHGAPPLPACGHPLLHSEWRRGPGRGGAPVHGKGENSATFDLVFSNAALHWVDDHEAVLRGAAAVLKPGGRLAISCGGKGNAHDVFLAIRPVMRLKRWREFFRRMPMPYFFYAPSNYEKWLPKFGFKTQALALTPKDATHDGATGFAAWLRTTWLPFVQRVPETLREEFIAAVTQRYVAKHPPDAEGKIHIRMVRLEIDATKI